MKDAKLENAFNITEAVCIPKSMLVIPPLSSVNRCVLFDMTKNPSYRRKNRAPSMTPMPRLQQKQHDLTNGSCGSSSSSSES